MDCSCHLIFFRKINSMMLTQKVRKISCWKLRFSVSLITQMLLKWKVLLQNVSEIVFLFGCMTSSLRDKFENLSEFVLK